MNSGNQLSTGQIDVVARYTPNHAHRASYTYAGTQASDRALVRLDQLRCDPEKEWGMVFNVDPSDRPGQHWLVLYSPAQDSTIECLDSFGTLDVSRYAVPEVQAIVRRVQPVTLPRLQSSSTYVCGHYCLAYLYARTHGKTPQRFAHTFSTTDRTENDRTVCRFVCSVLIPPALRPAFREAYLGPLGSPWQGCCCENLIKKKK